MNKTAHRHKGFFSVPSSWISKDIARSDEKVAIISVFGQTIVDANGYKTSPLELMLGKNIFRRNLIQPISLDDDMMAGIEGYYDADRRLVFLHLTGLQDSSLLLKSLNKLNAEMQEKGFLVVWSNIRVQYARSLMLLYSISHILLLCHPNHVFDITYIHLFRTLDAVRAKFQTASSIILKGVHGVTKDWHMNGRLCSPRVLFLFSSHLIPAHILNNSDGNKNTTNPLRKLELDLEYQIYRLLRKSRVITNVSSNSLFALPNNQPFVYVSESKQEALLAPNLISESLDNLCNPINNLSSNFNKMMTQSESDFIPDSVKANSYPNKDLSSITTLSDHNDADLLSHSLLSSISSEKKRNLEHSFNQFLKQHIDEALTRGFDDSVGRHISPMFFEVPKMSVWFEAFHKLYNYFIKDDLNHDSKQVVKSLKSSLETDIRFSDARCSKVLPLAVSSYKDGLPSHYTRSQHQSKLEVALGILAAQARGPMYDKYLAQLEDICETIWKDGRVGCETLSLTGNACHNERHRATEDIDVDQSLPVIDHASGVIYVNYCNCGHHTAQMDDPFSIRVANFDFYKNLFESCGRSEHNINFPTFKASVIDAKAAAVNTSADENWPSLGEKSPDADTPLEMSLELGGLSQGADSNLSSRVVTDQVVFTVEENDEQSPREQHSKEIAKEKEIDRQISTTEYLPGMLTSLSPLGLLPQFSSWSLVCLGPSSLYSHNAGICDQPGFLSGTNFLLPWDVTIKIRDKEKWPAIADSMGRKGFLLKNKKNRMGGDLTEFSVKIFLGTEYQCPRGHRFMMAGPDRHLKATNMGHVKDTAIKISNSDMPLYFPCPCSRSGSLLNGQLMRLHVVTPKAPVHVTLKPEVQPGPDPCARFVPQPSTYPPIRLLASAYYVLRLPFSYVGDNGAYYPPDPRQASPPSFAKLCRGCYGISELTFDR